MYALLSIVPIRRECLPYLQNKMKWIQTKIDTRHERRRRTRAMVIIKRPRASLSKRFSQSPLREACLSVDSHDVLFSFFQVRLFVLVSSWTLWSARLLVLGCASVAIPPHLIVVTECTCVYCLHVSCPNSVMTRVLLTMNLQNDFLGECAPFPIDPAEKSAL